MSWILTSNFVKFASAQLFGAVYSDYLTNNIMHQLGCPPFKNFVIDFILRTAVDFSMRAVEKGAKVRNELRTSGGVLRLSNNEIFATRFDRMRHWEDSDHPFVILLQAGVEPSDILPSGIGIISLNPRVIDQAMDPRMKEGLYFS